jgi:hypothetical protein
MREMKISIYKLGEYKIMESDTGELRWEAHFGIAVRQEGMCFKKGAILFIRPAESQRDGFLKLEFSDHLKGLPPWLKTKYYCGNVEVFHCKTGKKVSTEEMRLWMLNQGREGENIALSCRTGDDSNDLSSLMSRENVTFRLQRYEIIKKTDAQIVWKTHAGPNTVSSGNCIILEDILFIGSRQTEQSNLNKRQFLANLQQLPKWDQTRYYCPKLSLHDCKTGNRLQEGRERWLSEKTPTEKHDIRNRYKNATESKILTGTQRGIFSTRTLPIFESLADSAASRGENDRFFRFIFKKSYILKSIAIFRTSCIRKWITYTAALIFLILSSFFAFLIYYWEEHHESWHYKKGERASSHHRNR